MHFKVQKCVNFENAKMPSQRSQKFSKTLLEICVLATNTETVRRHFLPKIGVAQQSPVCPVDLLKKVFLKRIFQR